jgi:hypothetical protein
MTCGSTEFVATVPTARDLVTSQSVNFMLGSDVPHLRTVRDLERGGLVYPSNGISAPGHDQVESGVDLQVEDS